MCAINGFTWSDKTILYRMNEATKHRGPDATDTFVNQHISLGHNRLKIIDLSEGGHQPKQSNNGRFTIVFNGEIYNYKELKKELEHSYVFHTESDTEVILAAYEVWGKECVNRFNGIFAFAMWDREEEELFLARDHVGVKPLYYYHNDSTFIFSSEIKGILEHDIARVLNRKAFQCYMRVQYVPEPMTMIEGIHKLPPAHYAVYKNRKLSIQKYWKSTPKVEENVSKKTVLETVREKIDTSVARQLVSDRPVGIYLSGGIDSSAVLNSTAKVWHDISTFSIGFELEEGVGHEKFNSDFDLARKTAEHYKTTHHEVRLSSKDVVSTFENVCMYLDEPISNPTSIARFMLARFAKESGVDVVLSGDGGDELFGGYERYRLAYGAWMYQQLLPSFMRSALAQTSTFKKLNTKPGIDQFELFMFQKDDVVSRVLTKEAYANPKDFFEEKYFKNSNLDPVTQLIHTDRQSWLVDESLMQSDKMSMASGLEQRVPLLDKELVAFANTLPLSMKVSTRDTKKIMKEALKGELPSFLFNQPKRGWFSPAAKWLRVPEVQQYAEEILSPMYHEPTEKLFKWDEIEEMLSDHIDGKQYNLVTIWAIMTFQLWARQYQLVLE